MKITSEGQSRSTKKSHHKQREAWEIKIELYKDDWQYLYEQSEKLDISINKMLSLAVEGIAFLGELPDYIPYGLQRRDNNGE